MVNTSMTAILTEPVWEAFDPAACWWAGAVLWLWEASWAAPRLAVADEDEGGEWHYARGGRVGAGGAPSPTHCSVPVAPLPPQQREVVDHEGAAASVKDGQR
ncbi:hypothetical protein [Cupriavidus sp. TMH.W2]|uniref:hypothetical protein n=1 Tax=Cupriavidus sp. TMH.W2 TaxID=3434465 RepID=UPI003D76B7E3